MDNIGTVLVIEDDPAVVRALTLALSAAGGTVEAIAQPEALAALDGTERFNAAILDMNFAPGARDGGEGLAALSFLRKQDPTLAVVVLTVHGGLALAVRSLQGGACDFLVKPWRNAQLVEALRGACALTCRQRANSALSLDAIERQAIAAVLERHRGNISKAALALGLTRPALYRRLEKHGLSP